MLYGPEGPIMMVISLWGPVWKKWTAVEKNKYYARQGIIIEKDIIIVNAAEMLAILSSSLKDALLYTETKKYAMPL